MYKSCGICNSRENITGMILYRIGRDGKYGRVQNERDEAGFVCRGLDLQL